MAPRIALGHLNRKFQAFAFTRQRLGNPLISLTKPTRFSNLSGDDRSRTDNPCLAKAVLSQLSYVPKHHDLEPARNLKSTRKQRNEIDRLFSAFRNLLCKKQSTSPSVSGRMKIRTSDLVVISDAL